MTSSRIRLPLIASIIAMACLAWLAAGEARSQEKPAAPQHQVIACYFHRTVRCPTCRTISAYIEEAVKTGFAAEVKDGSVKLAMIDFQNAKNQAYTQAYHITGPTLVIMDVKEGKVVAWKPAPKVWTLVAKKDEFFKYVQGEVQSYLQAAATVSR
jgi:lipopolysaccharide export system protein LptC